MSDKIKYFFDAYCDWRYGFDSMMEKWLSQMPDDIGIELVSGGLFTGDRSVPIGEYTHIPQANARIHERD